jgi:hypothetical protein
VGKEFPAKILEIPQYSKTMQITDIWLNGVSSSHPRLWLWLSPGDYISSIKIFPSCGGFARFAFTSGCFLHHRKEIQILHALLIKVIEKDRNLGLFTACLGQVLV